MSDPDTSIYPDRGTGMSKGVDPAPALAGSGSIGDQLDVDAPLNALPLLYQPQARSPAAVKLWVVRY
jgi:hypothetical protein